MPAPNGAGILVLQEGVQSYSGSLKAFTNDIVPSAPKSCYDGDTGFREEEMRPQLACFLLLASQAPADACKIVWPNAEIAIPSLVHDFILSECLRYKGASEETLDDCIAGEAYGYRAVVTVLADANFGDKAAERYRACAAGLGDYGGRYHRRKAECIGGSLGLKWRFEYTART